MIEIDLISLMIII